MGRHNPAGRDRGRRTTEGGSTPLPMKIGSVVVPLLLVAMVGILALAQGSLGATASRALVRLVDPGRETRVVQPVIVASGQAGTPTSISTMSSPSYPSSAASRANGATGGPGVTTRPTSSRANRTTTSPARESTSSRTGTSRAANPTTRATQTTRTTQATASTATTASSAPSSASQTSGSPTTRPLPPPIAAPSAPTPPTATAPATSSEDFAAHAAEVLRLVNEERAKAGCPALSAHGALQAAATKHSVDMATNGYFSHQSQDGSTMAQRVTREGYQWSEVAENIAAGQATPAQVMDSWMNSEGHRINILHCSYKHLGVGIARAASGRLYWTQNFASPR